MSDAAAAPLPAAAPAVGNLYLKEKGGNVYLYEDARLGQRLVAFRDRLREKELSVRSVLYGPITDAQWKAFKTIPGSEDEYLRGPPRPDPVDAEETVVVANMRLLAVPPPAPVANAGAGAAGPAHGAGASQGSRRRAIPIPKLYEAVLVFRSNGNRDTAVGVRRAAAEAAAEYRVGGWAQRINAEEVRVVCHSLSEEARHAFCTHLIETMEYGPFLIRDPKRTWLDDPDASSADLVRATSRFKVIRTGKAARDAAEAEGRALSDDNWSIPDVGAGGRVEIVSDAGKSLDRILRLSGND